MLTFLTIYTPTFRRPKKLARCMASVAEQTAADRIQHLIVPDYVGVGIDGMYKRVPDIRDAVRGQYVHFLADDDVLAAPDVVERVEAFAHEQGMPEVIIVTVSKDGLELPFGQAWPPVCGQIDLGCTIVRADVWQNHCHEYGHRYEGDFDFADALARAGCEAVLLDLMFMQGDVMRGNMERP